MAMRTAKTWPIVKETGIQFSKHKGPRLGAALAFYTTLSLSPMLVVVIALAGLFFGEAAARGEIAHQIQTAVGNDGARAIQTVLAAHRSSHKGILMTVLGLATLFVGATGMFAQLQDALDTIWDVKRSSGGGILGTIRDRLLSFTLVCGLAFLILVSLVITAILSTLGGWLEDRLAVGAWVLQGCNLVVSFALTTALFAAIFKLLPHAYHAWSDVWKGAIITAGLFTLGKYLIGLYLGHAAPGSAYGAAGSLVVLLIWIYYSSQILLFGAEFTQVYANRCGTGLTKDLRRPCNVPRDWHADCHLSPVIAHSGGFGDD